MVDLDRAFAQLRTEDSLWALGPDHLHGLAERLARTSIAEPVRKPVAAGPLTNQIIPIIGPLGRRGSFITKLLGMATYDSIRAQLAAAVTDKQFSGSFSTLIHQVAQPAVAKNVPTPLRALLG